MAIVSRRRSCAHIDGEPLHFRHDVLITSADAWQVAHFEIHPAREVPRLCRVVETSRGDG